MSISAKSNWRVIDFISDLHLQASEAATFAAWHNYMEQTQADALFILGDLFEVWVGDDVVNASDDPDARFVMRCQQVLKLASDRMEIYFLHGNRDFLLGQDCADACGMKLQPDPCVLELDEQRWLLSHGDALCLGDVEYQQFRKQVRGQFWREHFLSKPVAERQSIARRLRCESEAQKKNGKKFVDLDSAAVLDLLDQAQATALIHGHTHHPADHLLRNSTGQPLQRLVLSDWDASATPPRLQVLRLVRGDTPLRLSLV